MIGPVLVVGPGGTDAQGGIGRHLRTVDRAWSRLALQPPLIVLDSYGLGARPSLRRFALAAVHILASRLLGRASLLHLHMAADGSVVRKLALAALARATALPVILHLHGSRFADQVLAMTPRRRARLARALAAADAVITLGEGMRTLLVETLGLDPARLHVMPNAVALRTPIERPPSGTPCRIVFLGRLGARKGVPDLLEALARLDRPDLAWCATLAGEGDVAAARDTVASLGLPHRVAITGWLDERAAASLLAGSDLLVLPSRREGQPMAILEAMSAGLAVVATAVGAIPELLRDGDNGLLVPPGDPTALADALACLIRDPALRARLGDAARETVSASHELDAFCRRLRALYDRVAARDHRDRGSALDPVGSAAPDPRDAIGPGPRAENLAGVS